MSASTGNRGKTPGKRKLLIQWAKPRSRILSTARLCWHQSRLCRLGKTRFRSSSCFCFGVSRLNIYTSHNRQESAQPASNFEAMSPLEGARVFAPVTYLLASEKVNFSGQECFFHMKNAPWQPWYGQENSGMRLFPVLFELTVAASDPCDRFSYVCSAYPMNSNCGDDELFR